MNEMTTLSEVLNILKNDGYTVDFNLKNNCLICNSNALSIYPEDFVVDRSYRFEGYTDPGDEAIVYAISSIKHGLKGTLVNAYGLYSDPVSSDIVRALGQKPSADAEKSKAENTSAIPPGIITIDDFIIQMEAEQNKSVNTRSLFKTKGLSILLIALHAEAELKKHTAPGPISVQVIEGAIIFRTDEVAQNLVKGQLLTLNSGIPHSVYAEERSIIMVTISA